MGQPEILPWLWTDRSLEERMLHRVGTAACNLTIPAEGNQSC